MGRNLLRTIGVVTTSRADYGIYWPILRQLEAAPDLQLHFPIVHAQWRFGQTLFLVGKKSQRGLGRKRLDR